MNVANNFDKEKFSEILISIKDSYGSINQMAEKTGVTSAYISKLIRIMYNNAPSPEILKKIARASNGIITYQELMQICGYLEENETMNTNSKSNLQQILKLANGLTIQETNYLIKQLNKAKIQIEKGE